MWIDIVFDGPPGPEAGRFVEVENSEGRSIRFGDWIKRPDGYWVLRIPAETEWQPIETAPKDRPIWATDGKWCAHVEWTDGIFPWRIRHFAVCQEYDWKPTHWRPAAPPPSSPND